MAKIFWIVFLGSLVVMTGCVETQDMVILENRVSSLEMDNVRHLERLKRVDRTLKDEFPQVMALAEKNDRMTREKYAEIKALAAQLREETRALEGRVEAVEFMLSRAVDPAVPAAVADDPGLKRLDHAITRNYQRILALETYLGFEPTDAPAAVSGDPGDDGASARPEDSETGMYKAAKTLLDNGNNDGAREAFEAFITAYPDSDNADNARFWIADSYYRDKWYEKAILEYQQVIERYSDGNKVPAALLKQGYSFANLGEKGNARLILKELIRKYPASSEAGIAREKLESLK